VAGLPAIEADVALVPREYVITIPPTGGKPIDAAIDLHDVVKRYPRQVYALQGINLQVGRGEVFGLLGPNGAGKSTLVKIMMSVVRPTRAHGTILGHPVGHKPTLAKIGYLPENHRFPRYLTGGQVLNFFAALAKVDRSTRKRRSAELLETVGMTPWADAKISTYSKGMMQRIGIAQALVHDPDLVVLDEPTDGVDPVGRRDVLNILGALRGKGKTVFINSHALSELESICDRVAILVKGQVALQGTMDALTVARERYEIELVFDSGADVAALRTQMLSAVGGQWSSPTPSPEGPIDRGLLNGNVPIERSGSVLSITTNDPQIIQPIIDALRAAGLAIRRVQRMRPSLEDLFMSAVIDPATGRAVTPGASTQKLPPPAGSGT
jgi:ABC-2 type transport system ATP-binding protein